MSQLKWAVTWSARLIKMLKRSLTWPPLKTHSFSASSVLRHMWPPLQTHFLQCWEVSKSQLRVDKLLISKSIKILNYFESSCLFNYNQEKHLSSTFIQSTKFEIRHSLQHRPNQCLNQCEWLFLKRWRFDSLIKAIN